jgi:hypothetical protein
MPNLPDAQEKTVDASWLTGLQDLIAALPADDAVAAVRQIAQALAAMNSIEQLPLTDRYNAVCRLDSAMIAPVSMLLSEYLNTSRHMKQRESDLWNSAYPCWRELAVAYAHCVQHYAADRAAVPAFGVSARIAAARAMRALRRQLHWGRIRYAPPAVEIWERLAALYAQCEGAEVTDEMPIYADERTTVQREFLETLALAVLTSDNLMPPEQEMAGQIVSRHAGEFAISSSADTGMTHAFDLAHPQAPQPIERVKQPGADERFFGAGAAAAALDAALQQLGQTRELPASLGFLAPVDAAVLTPVLAQICLDWSGKAPGRRHSREKTNARVSVVPGFKEIIGVLEKARADPFDFTAKPTAESWIASDVSPDGFGVLMPAVSGDWVSVGSVLGIEGESGSEWAVGMVRRVRRLDNGQQHIGVQVLCRDAQAVRVMREMSLGAHARITERMPIDACILLTPDVGQQKEVELLVRDPAPYGETNLHVLTSDCVLLVKLTEIVEATPECTRIRVAILGIEK